MTTLEGPAILTEKVTWKAPTMSTPSGRHLIQKGGSHQLMLLRRSQDHMKWPSDCTNKAIIMLQWDRPRPADKPYAINVFGAFGWQTRILFRGSWRKTMDEWERLVHTLDIEEYEKFYRMVEEME
jgi:hypothetical protein